MRESQLQSSLCQICFKSAQQLVSYEEMYACRIPVGSSSVILTAFGELITESIDRIGHSCRELRLVVIAPLKLTATTKFP